ncbi:unnamed protein product [Echinostoma caproni]|uniref:Leucine-rich repeat-containing protein 27 n=1 Tax=Echinostoma caproni TaxID=27848 RepID=A0A183AGV6_9TREM|nr:unnamed protein product [Echinostoma caproni]
MTESVKESELEQSTDLESPDYFEAIKRIKKVENEKPEKLDLSNLRLVEVPRDLLDLTHLKRLHLCRNRLLEIPDELCARLCSLTWLDLRSNLLTRLPGTIRHMRDLQILLLDDNCIRILPFELGDSETDRFEITEENMKELCDQLERKASLSNSDEGFGSEKVLSIQEMDNSGREESTSSVFTEESNDTLKREEKLSVSRLDTKSGSSDQELEDILHFSRLTEAVNEELNTNESDVMAGLQVSPFSRSFSVRHAILSLQLPSAVIKIPSASAFALFPSQSTRHDALLPDIPPQPTIDKIRAQHVRERKKKARQQAMITQQATLQKLKDAERVRGWRQAYTIQQKAKLLEYLSKTQRDIREEADRRATAAPFDVVPEDLKMIGTAELQELRNRCIRSASPPPNLDPHVILELELARYKQRSPIVVSMPEDVWKSIIGKAPLIISLLKVKRILYTLKVGQHSPVVSDESVAGCNNTDSFALLYAEYTCGATVNLERDRRLTEQVQRHLSEVGGRFQIPLPNTREALYAEMLTAKRDLDLALRLHHRVKQRMETMEHFRGSNRRDLW